MYMQNKQHTALPKIILLVYVYLS